MLAIARESLANMALPRCSGRRLGQNFLEVLGERLVTTRIILACHHRDVMMIYYRAESNKATNEETPPLREWSSMMMTLHGRGG